MIGQTIAHYRITEKLGAGGMGEVYRASDERLGREVALKVLPAAAVGEEKARARLVEEARMASALNHPHICTIHEVGEAVGRLYIAMELVDGKPLGVLIPSRGLPIEAVMRYGEQIAGALTHAHDRRIVHRDLKTANVVITPEGRAKVLDFGLARRMEINELDEATKSRAELSEAEMVAGTLHYLAPETLRGAPPDPRIDIWALGVVLHEMASGELPFQGRTGYEVTSAILRESAAPLPARVPAGLRGVIERCLAKEPGQRYQRASEVAAALEAIRSDTAMVAPVQANALVRHPPRWVVGAGVAVLAAVALAIGLNVGGWRERLLGSAQEGQIRSLAILPLKSLGHEASNDYLGMGIADTIITKVSQIGGLTVRPTSAVRKYAQTEKDALEAARELEADSVLDGTVQREGNRLRVNLNLLRVRDGGSLWSDSFDVRLTDIFAMQDEVARQVATRLRLRLSPVDEKRVAKRYTSSPEAYEYYVRGMQSLDKRGLTSNERPVVTTAITLFQKAIELDPGYALAQAQLAYAYAWMALFTDPATPGWFARAKEEMARTEALDPDLAELHLVRQEIYWSAFEGFKIAEAARELIAAQKLNPAIGHEQLSVVFMHMGLEGPALREINRALEIDPTSDLNKARLVETHDLLGNADEAIALNQRFGDHHGINFYLRKSYLWKKQFDRARQINERVLARTPDDPFGLSNQMLLNAARGNFQGFEAKIPAIVENVRRSRAFHHVTYNIACVYALAGRAAPAVEWLKKTVETGMPNYTLFIRDSHLDPIRKDPAFVAFLKDLEPRWEAYQQEFR